MKQKIYWLISHLYKAGGVELVTGEIIDALKNQYDITVVLLSDDISNYDIFPKYKNINTICFNIPHKVIRNEDFLRNTNFFSKLMTFFRVFYFTFFGRFKYRRKLKKMTCKDDIIISTQLNSFLIAPKKRKNIFHFHYSNIYFNSLYNRMILSISVKPISYVFLCNSSCEDYKKSHKKLSSKCHYIYNPCRIKPFEQFENMGKRICFFARLEKQKNPLFVVEIMKYVHKKDPDVILDLYGKGYLEDKVRLKIKELHLENNIYLKGLGNPEVLRNYSLLLVTDTMSGGFNLNIAEANTQGTPALTVDFSLPTKEAVKEDINGYIIDDNNPQTFANKVIELLNNPNKLKQLRLSSYEFAKNFSIDKIKKDWINYLDSFKDF